MDLGRWKAHYGRRSGRKALMRASLVTFGGAWLVLEPAGLFFPDAFEWGLGGYFGLIVVALVAGAWLSRPRSAIEQRIPPTDVEVAIQVGNLLDQQGNVVIGVADTFDTSLEDEIISPRSVQGQLLQNVFRGEQKRLDRFLAEALVNAQGDEDPSKAFGKTTRYPIGTVARIVLDDRRLFLAAFTEMSSSLPPNVSSSVADLYVALARTWAAVDVGGQGEPVHVAVMGANLARIQLSKTLLIQLIVLSFLASGATQGPKRLVVWVHERDEDTVDFAMLREWLSGLCAA